MDKIIILSFANKSLNNMSLNILLRFLMAILFFDENLKRVFNIENFIKKLQGRSQNFFLFHKSIKIK